MIYPSGTYPMNDAADFRVTTTSGGGGGGGRSPVVESIDIPNWILAAGAALVVAWAMGVL